jgi:nucleoside-diphosphate-sugar epimerase
MHVDVIGGSGFIGTRLCRRLADSNSRSFRIIDKIAGSDFPSATTIADVRSCEELRAAITSGSVLVNLAAEHRDDVRPASLYDEVNVDGARNLCRVAVEKGIQIIVFTSSVAVYGFAEIGTDESGVIAPFNDYGRTKAEAESVYKRWQAEDPGRRTLVIVRPTVVFGERNRGNVFNLLKQLASRFFVMVGGGENRKSIAYVENVAAFIEHCLGFAPGVHIYNYVDKPDYSMNELTGVVLTMLGRDARLSFRVPYGIGMVVGRSLDLLSRITGRRFALSAIRVKKFCSDSVFGTSVASTGFVPPVSLEEGLRRTVDREFLSSGREETLFFSE